MSRHRQQAVRPRYGRIAVLGASVAVTAIAVLGGTGVLPTPSPQEAAAKAPTTAVDPAGASLASAATDALAGIAGTPDATEDRVDPSRDTALPAGSGSGYRVVFSQSRQRVWLVPRGHRVERTYLVSGSLYDNLDPGTYEVYSRSEQAWGIDDSGTMKYFVRFAHGDSAAIGFHDIPIDDGKLVQTVAELGTPMSHGCIRQRRPDAIALWKFAPLGTKVVVTK
jgi:hypothetical protein